MTRNRFTQLNFFWVSKYGSYRTWASFFLFSGRWCRFPFGSSSLNYLLSPCIEFGGRTGVWVLVFFGHNPTRIQVNFYTSVIYCSVHYKSWFSSRSRDRCQTRILAYQICLTPKFINRNLPCEIVIPLDSY